MKNIQPISIKKCWIMLSCTLLGLFVLCPVLAVADTVTFNLDTKLSGDTLGSIPVATLEDLAGTNEGKVLLTLTMPINSQYNPAVKQWLFNFSKSSLSGLQFTKISGDSASSIGVHSNYYKADGKDSYFDIKFSWTGSFTENETIKYLIGYTSSDIYTTDFVTTAYARYDSNNDGKYYSALYWENCAGWVATDNYTQTGPPSEVPEPTSLILLGTGLGVIGIVARIRRK
jgi:hypothetical protein